jgi:hypothetical protein
VPTPGGIAASTGTRARRRAANTTRGCSLGNVPRAEEVYAEAQEREARLTRSFFEGSRKLVELAGRGRPSGRDLFREGLANPYAEFLECLFLFYYRTGARTAERSTGGSGVQR